MSITRSEVIQRAATIWPLGHVPYSQMTVRNPGWRTDCSGYASMCLDLSPPGLNTVSLVTGGPQLGPEHSLIHDPYHGLEGYKPYRYKEIVDSEHELPGGHWVSVTAWPDPMSTIGGIAAHSAIADWPTLWDDPHNAGLRAHRTTPDHVQPGDAVWVP